MSNQSGKAYALTTLCPIKAGTYRAKEDDTPLSHAVTIRALLQDWNGDEGSPMAKVANTYLCRFLVLDDVVFEGKPAKVDQLKSKYLIFSANFHGDLDSYLKGMWTAIHDDITQVWQHCVDFESVTSAESFVTYIKRCQVTTTFYFNGSNDDPVSEQLKALYLKQEFSRFVFDNQGLPPAELQRKFIEFVGVARPMDVCKPSWRPGQAQL